MHDHRADRRGRHFDLRLGDPETGHAHSWAMSASWPAPGEKAWAIRQPTHTIKYMDFVGEIPSGYGKGKVDLHLRDRTEVTSSSPHHVRFNVYRSAGPEEYSLHQVDGKKWLLTNRTLDRKKEIHLPDSKPDYREVQFHQAPVDDPRYIASAKIDDAHNLFMLPASGEQIRVVSYRKAKKTPTGIIEHTHKVPGILGTKTPAGLGGTILRGGLYALDPKTGEAVPPQHIAGLLNSDVWKSREKQKETGSLISVLYDVVRYRGRDMQHAPYSDKLKVLREVEKALPDVFHLPRMASSTEDKRKLLEDVAKGRLPETKEGVVFWNTKESAPPIKAKVKEEHDVYIQGTFPAAAGSKYDKNAVGGFYFSHEPDGPIVGRVGTGLSDEQRRHMHQNPELYKGMVARISTMKGGKYPSGAIRTGAFEGFHLDKNEPTQLGLVKHAEEGPRVLFLWGESIR